MTKLSSFYQVLKLSNIESLKTMNLDFITKFRKKAYRSEKFKHWFCESYTMANGERTRGNPVSCLKPVPFWTKRFEKSKSPFMTKLLLWHPPFKYAAPDLA